MKLQYLLKHYKTEASTSFLNELILENLDSLSIIEDNALQRQLLHELLGSYVSLEKKVDTLLRNTLPQKVAEEIKFENGFAPREYDCTILFSDFVAFTRLAELMPGAELIETLNRIFTEFDRLIIECRGTKIKTIGDSYMAVFGAPERYDGHAVLAMRGALGMFEYLDTFNRENDTIFEMRIGVHSGRVMAGVIGTERMQFDVFGDDVNIASRFESSGKKGKVNVSEETYLRVKECFEFEERGLISLRNKQAMKAYFLLNEKSNAGEGSE